MGSGPASGFPGDPKEWNPCGFIGWIWGGSSDKWTDHLLLLREVDKTNHEMEFVENWGEIRTNLIFVNQNRAETFIWQEIGSQIRKVYEILVRLVGATLHLNRKTVKYTRNHTFFSKNPRISAMCVRVLELFLGISFSWLIARIFWQLAMKRRFLKRVPALKQLADAPKKY